MLVQLAIAGQYWENYGAHEWDGVGDCPQSWRPKSSSVVMLACNVGMQDINSMVPMLNEAMEAFSYHDHGSECQYDTIQFYPNKLSDHDTIYWDFAMYDNITSVSMTDIQSFLAAKQFMTIKDSTISVDPAPLPYEEYDLM